MKKTRRRKKRAGTSSMEASDGSAGNTSLLENDLDEKKIISSLVEAFSLASVDEAKAAYEQAGGCQVKAADILSGYSDKVDAQTSCSNSSGCPGLCSTSASCSSSSGYFGSESACSSEGVPELNDISRSANGRGCKGTRGKKIVASAGTVSTMMGKGYITTSCRTEMKKSKRESGKVDVEEMEQFLCSMLGDETDLSMAVVKDVLCQCEYDVEKALDVLLDLSASSFEPRGSDNHCTFSGHSRDNGNLQYIDENDFWQLTDKSPSTCHPYQTEVQERPCPSNNGCRSYSEAVLCSDTSRAQSSSDPRTEPSNIPRELLESLFSIRKGSSVHEPSTMDWKNIVKKMETFAQKQIEHGLAGASQLPQSSYVKGSEYDVLRGEAKQHWDSMKTSYQKAATAYSNGSRSHATYLSEQGLLYNKMAQKADEKASLEIFKARNKDIENVVTIDLHGQHVKQAMRFVKLHLLFATFVSSVQYLRVITGSGSHGMGKSKLKQSVIDLLRGESILWKEENTGTVLIKLDGPKEFSFLDSGSDSE